MTTPHTVSVPTLLLTWVPCPGSEEGGRFRPSPAALITPMSHAKRLPYKWPDRTGGGLVKEDDRGVGDKLDRNGQPLALLQAQPCAARHAHQEVAQRGQLHQLQHLRARSACSPHVGF